MAQVSEALARELAKGDRHYVARPDRVGDGWHVWDCVSDHRVEFNLADFERVARSLT